MRPRMVLGLAVALTGLAAGACGPGHVPAGQPNVVTITDGGMPTIQEAFNQAAAHPRVVLLISPT